MKIKKILAVLLVAAIVFSTVCSAAASETSRDSGCTVSLGEGTVQPNGSIVIPLNIEKVTQPIYALNIQIVYNHDVLRLEKIGTRNENEYSVLSDMLMDGGAYVSSDVQSGIIPAAFTNGCELTGTYWWLTFSAKEEPVNGAYDITLEGSWDNASDSQLDMVVTTGGTKLDYTLKPGTVTVAGGVEPVATTVEVTADTDTVAVPTKAAVEEGNPTKVQMSAVVKNQIGAAMSEQKVTWSVVETPAGVSVDQTGLVTVDNTAQDGEVTVKATCGTVSGTAKLTLTKEPRVVASVEADDKTVDVPATIDSPRTVELTAKVYDQYGLELSGKNISWSSAESMPDGVEVMLAQGKLSVSSNATPGVGSIRVSCEGVSDIAYITFSKATAVPTTVTIYKGGAVVSADSITIPQTGSTTVPYSAVVTDQYGATMPNHVATWTLTPAGQGLSVNANNGDVTAEANAEPGTYTLTATCGSASATMTITAAQIQFTVGDGAITVAENPTYGATWGEIVTTIDDTEITATVGGEPVTGTYSVKDADQRPDAGAQTYTIVFNGSGYTNVTVTTGQVEIAPKTVTLSITGETTVSYGTDYSHAASYDAVAGDEVDATITYLNSTGETIAKPANAGSYQVKATINDANYFAAPVTQNFTITKVTLGDGVYLTKNINLVKDCSSPQTGKVTLADLFGDQIPDGAAIQSVTPGSGNLIDTIISYTDYVEYTSNTNLGDGANEIYTIKLSFTNFVDIDVTLSFFPVDKFDVSDQITFPNGTAVYNGAEQTYAKATCTLDEGEITYSYSPAAVKNAGTYTVTATYEDDFNMGSKTATFTITKKPVTVSAGSAAVTKTYDGTATAGTRSGSFAVNGICSQDVTTDGYVTAGTLPAYSNANVHSENLSVPVTLKAEFATNYSLSSSSVSVPATITAKAITPTVEDIAAVTYNGKAQEPAVTVLDGTTALTAGDYTVKYENNVNAGTAKAIITAKAGGNYTFDQVTKNFTINKANYTGSASYNVNVLTNQETPASGTISVDAFFQNVPAEAKITNVAAKSATNHIMYSVSASASDGTITYQSNTNLKTADLSDTYDVTISTRNYNDITATLTFTTVDKTPVIVSGVAVAGKTYDGKTVSYTGTPVAKKADGSTVAVTGFTYTWMKDGVALTGAPKDAGSYQLRVAVAETDPAYTGYKDLSFTISKATVTITAQNASVTVNSSMPKLSYQVTGLAAGEKLATEPTLTCNAKLNQIGSYAIVPAGAAVPNTGNYNETIVYKNGTLSVVSNEKPQVTVTGGAHGFATISDPDAKEGDVVTIQVTCDPGYEVDEVIVTTLSGKSVRVVKTGGKYTFVMPEEKVKIQVTYQEIQEVAYSDVVVGSWYEEAVAYVSDNGLMNGVGGGKFAPNRTVTRAMVWTVLARMDGEDTASTSLWYAKAQQWAMETGVSDGTNPESAITREQLATMLYRYYGSPAISGSLSGYADGASVTDWAKDAMVWAVQEGLIQGTGANKLSPTADTTRAQLAQILMRLDLKF